MRDPDQHLVSSRQAHRCAAGIALLAVFAATAPPSAFADGFLVAPGQPLIEVKLAKGGGGAVAPNSAAPLDGTLACAKPWVTVASVPSGYATGNCKSGVHMHRTLRSDVVPEKGFAYDGGEIFGNYAGCGWIGVPDSTTVNSTYWTNCYPVVGYNLADFATSTDGCAGTSSCNGTYLDNPRVCTKYANYQPWLSGRNPTDPLTSAPAHSTLFWRYIARYPARNGTGQYVMVRAGGVAAGNGNWVFVPRSCLGLGEQAGSSISPSVVRDAATGNSNVFYQRADGQVWSWSWTAGMSGSGWVNSGLGTGQPAAGATTSAVRDASTGNANVYYQGANGQIWSWSWTSAAGWVNAVLGFGQAAAAGTSPNAVRDASNGSTNVYYRGTNGQIWSWNWTSATGWVNAVLGSGQSAAGGNPTAVRDASNGNTNVYYRGANGQMWSWNWTAATGWLNVALGSGQQVAATTTPTAVRDASNGNTNVYYQGANNQLWSWSWTSATGWVNAVLGSGQAVSGSPAAIRDASNGNSNVFYRGANGQMWSWNWTAATGWVNAVIGSGMAVADGASPAAVRDAATGNANVYYQGTDAEMFSWSWTAATGWQNRRLQY